MPSPRRLVTAVALAMVSPLAAAHAQRIAPAHAAGTTLRLPGLRAPVELRRDSAGVVHIRARSEHDLFMAQGWSVARDRLFQLEHWRRLATGTLAELVGPRGVPIDESLRLLRYRGDVARDLAWYHPRGAAIVQAFVDGINAYVDAANRDTTLLPPEFRMLGARPGRWTPAVVISRHNGLFGNADRELALAREVRQFGDSMVRARREYGPGDPMLRGDGDVDIDALTDAVLARYRAHQRGAPFVAGDLLPAYRTPAAAARLEALVPSPACAASLDPECLAPREGSNNWVVAGARSRSGKPLVANDPHRAITVPSLRYLVHLEAPGWQVIGGGEPALPGVAIGRTPHGAWGLTIFSMDMEDLVVLRLAPGDPDAWLDTTGRARRMRLERDTIRVKGSAPVPVTHRFTPHGPVLHVDTARGIAVALRAAWHERGTAPYLASLRLDQARTWREFRAALSYARAPALNWVWGDTAGRIGWQAAGIAPIRRGFSGLVPVSARRTWAGFLDIAALPGASDPARGWLHSANEMNVPAGYRHGTAITPGGWAEPWRARRIAEVLDTLRDATLADMARLQHDDKSLAALQVLRDLAARCPAPGADAEVARRLAAWDGRMDTASVAALLWRGVDSTLRRHVGAPSVATERLAADLARRPDCAAVVADAYATARRLATTPDGRWRPYGAWHRTGIEHPFAGAASDSLLAILTPPSRPRGGDGTTPFATGNTALQRAGASLRVVFDLAHPDSSRFTSTPGQSGDPRSPWYLNLYEPWLAGRYLPLPMTRAAVERFTAERTTLRP